MNEPGPSEEVASPPVAPGRSGFFRQQLPYIVVLVLAISGVAYTNISQQPLVGYWEFLTLALAVVCIVLEWQKADSRQARVQLILKQAMHWGSILVAMNIMLLAGVQQLMPSPATSLVLLMLLALGTFLAGLNLPSLQLSFLGLAMAFAVPAIAWLKQSALFLVLIVVLVIGVGLAFEPRRRRTAR
jgi:hypothetical protein